MTVELTSEEHDHAVFRECLVLADTVRRFLAVNERALATLSDLNAIHDCQMLVNDSAAAQGARERRLVAARRPLMATDLTGIILGQDLSPANQGEDQDD